MNERRFWKTGLSGDLTVGEAYAAAKKAMAPDAQRTAGFHWCQSELTLLGDPTLDLRARDPVTPSFTAPKTIKRGRQTVRVTTRPGATVCLWKGEEVYAVGKANDAGRAEFAIAPATAGTVKLGHPLPESNLSPERNSSWPQATQR